MAGIKSISSMIEQNKDTILGFDKWKVQDAVNTLQRAKEINDDPAFMKAVGVEAERQKQALSGIANSSGTRNRRHGPDGI